MFFNCLASFNQNISFLIMELHFFKIAINWTIVWFTGEEVCGDATRKTLVYNGFLFCDQNLLLEIESHRFVGFKAGFPPLASERKAWFPYDRKRSRIADRRSQRMSFPYNRKRSQRKVLSHISVLRNYENYGLWAILWLELISEMLNSHWAEYRRDRNGSIFVRYSIWNYCYHLQNFAFASSAYILNIFPI